MAFGTCSQCEREFTSLSGFDKHQTMNPDGRGVTCKDPATIGLVEVDGAWSAPASDKPIVYKAADEPRVEKVYKCRNCGGDFKGLGGRGRPPVTCNREGCGGKGLAV